MINKVNEHIKSLDSVEISFKDQYVGRNGMWNIHLLLQNQCLYQGQILKFSNGHVIQIDKLKLENEHENEHENSENENENPDENSPVENPLENSGLENPDEKKKKFQKKKSAQSSPQWFIYGQYTLYLSV